MVNWVTVAMGVSSILSTIGAYFMGKSSAEKPAENSGINIVTEQSRTSLMDVFLAVMLICIVLTIILTTCFCCYITHRKSLKRKYRADIVPLRSQAMLTQEEIL